MYNLHIWSWLLTPIFPGCKIRLFLLFRYPLPSFFFGMHSGQVDVPLVFLCSNGQLSEIVCKVKCVLNCSFIRFRQKARWNARFVLLHRDNQSELSGFQLHGQRNWRVIIVSGNVSACSRHWWNQIQNSLGWGWHSRCMSASSRANFGRNQVEGFASARTYTLMPYLLGLFGMYCLKLHSPLNPWRDSSTVQPVTGV